MPSFIFDSNDAASLMERNLMRPAERRRWEISSSLMFESSEDSSVDSAINFTLSFTVPESIESEECLQYLGFTESKAADTWAEWLSVKLIENNEQTLEHHFLDYALSAIPEFQPGSSQTDWQGEMLSWGVRTELREAIMDATFTNIRLTETAQHWVKDTFEIRYLTLERLQRESHSRAQILTEINLNTGLRPTIATASAAPSNVPGTLFLYKAISQDRFRTDANGKILIESLISGTPSDFRGVGGTTLYLAPSLDVAEHYKGYIKRRHNASRPLIVRFSVSNSFIESLPPSVLPFGDLWKEVVYTSRRGLMLRGDLKKIHRYPLIIGPISSSHNRTISSLDNLHQISAPSHVLFVKGCEGKQYVFQGDETMEKLEENAQVAILSSSWTDCNVSNELITNG